MERGVVTAWLKEEGDQYQVGEPLYEVETDKSLLIVEAKLPGTLVRKVAVEGSDLPVKALVAVVADPQETLSDEEVDAAVMAETAAADGAVGIAAQQATAGPPPRRCRTSRPRGQGGPGRCRRFARSPGRWASTSTPFTAPEQAVK